MDQDSSKESSDASAGELPGNHDGSTAMSTITFGGLATGIDTASLIEGLMAVQRIPLDKLEAKQSSLTTSKSTLSRYLNDVSDIKAAAEALSDSAGFQSLSATTSGSGVVASVTGRADVGTYTIDVNKLAQEQRTKSDAQTSGTSALNQSGTLSITVGGGAQVDISVSASDSLSDIAVAINNSDADVTATVIYEGPGSYRLMVRGNETGDDQSITFGGTVTLGLDSALNTYQTAQNAEIVLDGEFTISRSTNQFTNVIGGISLAVTAETSSPITLNIESDHDSLISKIQTLVSTYNDAISAGHSAAGFGVVTSLDKNLSGDSAIRSSLMQLSVTISTPVSGLTGRYNMLASAGLHLTRDGKLELDEDALRAALEDDAEAVEKLFTGDSETSVDGAMVRLMDVIDSLTDGSDSTIQIRIDSMAKQIDQMGEDMEKMELRLEDYETRLRARFTALEVLVSQIQAQESALAGITDINSD